MTNVPNYCHVSDEFMEEYELWNYHKLDEVFERANIAILFGGRNTGKSTGFAKWLCENVVYKGRQFVYLVRTSDQTSLIDYFSQVDDRIEYKRKEFRLDGNTIGYCVALTQEEKVKSQIDFSNVSVVVFEEFTRINPDDYLAEETTHLASLLSTIKRFRDIKMVCIGNNNTKMNCYNPLFEEFGLEWDNMGLKQGDCYYNDETGVYLEFVKNGKRKVAENLGILKAFPSYVAVYGEFARDEEVLNVAVKGINKMSPLSDTCFKVKEGKFISYYMGNGCIVCRVTDIPTKGKCLGLRRVDGERVYRTLIDELQDKTVLYQIPLRFYSYEAKYYHTQVVAQMKEKVKLR